jgi:hypothetical protein
MVSVLGGHQGEPIVNIAGYQSNAKSRRQLVLRSTDTTKVLFDGLLELNQREALVHVRKVLAELVQDVAADAKMPKLLGKVTPNQLTKLVSCLSELDDFHVNELAHALDFYTGIIETLQRRLV